MFHFTPHPLRLLSVGLLAVSQTVTAQDRVAEARTRAEPALRAAFQNAGISYPAEELFFRAFKKEATLEMWARAAGSKAFRLVSTYPVLASSGQPGPKRREGDLQVPEGFYEVDRFNPASLWHLSLGLNYPNAADRILSDKAAPGSDIFIHGNQVSVGCLPMGDAMIEAIYIAAQDSAIRPIRVHIFPARMSGKAWLEWRAAEVEKQPALDAFWRQLQPGYDAFEKTHAIPKVSVSGDGRYAIER